MAGVFLVIAQLLKDGKTTWSDRLLAAGFSAVFSGFALSAAWYLLDRKYPSTARSSRARVISAVVTAGFGLASGFVTA